jgi:NAD(P)-dependent dehydrogenase (short-subunit alcohol dehydrogenase family)
MWRPAPSARCLAPNRTCSTSARLSEKLVLPGLSAYATAKAGLETFAQVLAKEQPRWKITVVRPGAVATRFWERVPFRMPPKALQPEDVALRILEAYYNEQKGTLDIIPE